MKHTIAAVMIQDGDRYLMIQEKKPICYGQWNWPAGHVDAGETVEQAAVREVKEESGLDVVLGPKVGEWYDEDAERTRVLFSAESFSGDVKIRNSEILGSAWLTRNQITVLSDSMRSKDWTVGVIEDEYVRK